MAQDGLILTESQLAALEKAKADKEAHGEFDSACPGYCGAQDTFYVGTLKGVGRIYQQTFVDTYAKVGFTKLYDVKTAITAADLLNDRVIPFYEEHSIPLCRVLTDRGSEYCGNPERHEYELYLAIFGPVQQRHDPLPHDGAAFVPIAVGALYDVRIGRQFEPVENDARRFGHAGPHPRHFLLGRSSSALINSASWTGAHISMPRSVARQQASRSISAPFACIGKLRKERSFECAGTCTRQPNTVCSPRSAWRDPDQRQNTR